MAARYAHNANGHCGNETNAQGSYHTAIAGQEMRAVAMPALSQPPRPVCKLCRHFV